MVSNTWNWFVVASVGWSAGAGGRSEEQKCSVYVASSAPASSELTPATLHVISSTQHIHVTENTHTPTLKENPALCRDKEGTVLALFVRVSQQTIPSRGNNTQRATARTEFRKAGYHRREQRRHADLRSSNGGARVLSSALRLRNNRRRRAARSAENRLHGSGGGDAAAGDQKRHVRHLLPGTAHLLPVPGELLPVVGIRTLSGRSAGPGGVQRRLPESP